MTKRMSDFLEQRSRPSKILKLVAHSEVGEQIGTFMSSEKVSSVSDITLISSDGAHIPTVRALLVIRSSYFEKMLINGFAESKSNVIKLPIPATPLRHALKYIYTGECALLRKYYSQVSCDLAIEIIDLASAADYLTLDMLLGQCTEAIMHSIHGHGHILCCLLEKLTTKRSKWIADSGVVEDILDCMRPFATINKNYDGCKLRHGVLHLGDTAIRMIYEKILDGPGGPGELSSCFFQALLIWASNDTLPIINDRYNFDDESCILIRVDKTRFLDDRIKTAKYLARKFDLGRMTPAFLNEIVQNSGLVEPDAINEAYKKLALRFEKRERRALDCRDRMQLTIFSLEQEKRQILQDQKFRELPMSFQQ